MKREKVGLEHREILSGRFRRLDLPLSEYTFANIFLFRTVHEYEMVFAEDLFIKGRTYDGRRFLMPTAPLSGIDPGALKTLMSSVDFLFPIPESWTGSFDRGAFTVSYNKGDTDYLYTVEKMSTLKGRKLHKKRNLLAQFMDGHDHDAMRMTEQHLDEAAGILEEWQQASGMERRETDYQPCREALEHFSALGLCGGISIADGEPAGFVIGERLNAETVVIHFAKARKKFKGIYQYLFNTFAKVLPEGCRYLNLEQDLNRENLRVFKSSYVPDMLLKKARVRLK